MRERPVMNSLSSATAPGEPHWRRCLPARATTSRSGARLRTLPPSSPGTRVNAKFLPGFRIPESVRIAGPDSGPPGLPSWPSPPTRPSDMRPKLTQEHIEAVNAVVSVAKGHRKRDAQAPHRDRFRTPCARADCGAVRPQPRRGGLTRSARDRRHRFTGRRFSCLVQTVFSTERFRVYTSPDAVGVELCGALKNVIAIAAGICDGAGFGDNAKAALITRGLVEFARLGEAMGAKRSTFAGLAGMGDLITTCFSPFGRNLAVGRAIGRGEKLSAILKRMEQVAEGVPTTRSARSLSDKFKVEMPISEEVYRVLFEDKSPKRGLNDLMHRGLKPEEDQ